MLSSNESAEDDPSPESACRAVRQSVATLTATTASCDAAGVTSTESAFDMLSVRQRQVVGMLADGLSSKEIATRLSVSIKTIETHRAAAMMKLHANGVADLTKYAVREGLTAL